MAQDLTLQPSRIAHGQDGKLYYNQWECTNNVKGLPYSITISAAAGSANVSLVTITVKDETGTAVTAPVILDVWLSDAATGIGLTSTTASGAVAAGASGTDLGVLTTKKANHSITNASGVYILSITDTGKTGFYVAVACGRLPVAVSAQLTSGSYG